MSKSGGGRDGRTPSGELTIKMLRRGEAKIDIDFSGAWTTLSIALQRPERDFWSDLSPVPHYEAQVRSGGYAPAEADQILANSDRARVAAYNALADEFNADLERIQREKDVQAARAFYERAMRLIKGDRQ